MMGKVKIMISFKRQRVSFAQMRNTWALISTAEESLRRGIGEANRGRDLIHKKCV